MFLRLSLFVLVWARDCLFRVCLLVCMFLCVFVFFVFACLVVSLRACLLVWSDG